MEKGEKFHTLSAADSLEALAVDSHDQGLSSEEASKRLSEYGLNGTHLACLYMLTMIIFVSVFP